MTNLSQDVLRSIEADSFWCMSKLLDGIQVSWFCPCGSPGPGGPVSLWAPYCPSASDSPPLSMVPPLFGPSVSASFTGFTALKRHPESQDVSTLPWLSHQSMPSLLLCTQAMWSASAEQPVRLSHTLLSVDSFVPPTTGTSFGKTACAFTRFCGLKGW